MNNEQKPKTIHLQYTPEQIITILHSIKKVALEEDGCIEVWMDEDICGASARSFEWGSFTRELLALIEEYLNGTDLEIKEDKEDNNIVATWTCDWCKRTITTKQWERCMGQGRAVACLFPQKWCLETNWSGLTELLCNKCIDRRSETIKSAIAEAKKKVANS